MKLIKINADHYVVVDDSEIKEGDWVIDSLGIRQITSFESVMVIKDITHIKKITHSTQPLGIKPITDKVVIEKDKDNNPLMSAQYVELDMSCTVKPLSLQEVKELIGEVDVEKKALAFAEAESYGKLNGDLWKGFLFGYNQALEDNKEKKYTEKDIDKAYWTGMQFVGEDKGSFGEFIQSLHPKTEWEVEFVDGKLKLM